MSDIINHHIVASSVKGEKVKYSEVRKYIRSYEVNVGKTELQEEDTEIVINVDQVRKNYKLQDRESTSFDGSRGYMNISGRGHHSGGARTWRQTHGTYIPGEESSYGGTAHHHNRTNVRNMEIKATPVISQGSLATGINGHSCK